MRTLGHFRPRKPSQPDGLLSVAFAPDQNTSARARWLLSIGPRDCKLLLTGGFGELEQIAAGRGRARNRADRDSEAQAVIPEPMR